jgi:hypothetical protein
MKLKAKRIDYTLNLGDKESKYSLDEVELKPRSVTKINIDKKVTWGFSFDIVKDMILGKDTILELEGDVIIMESPLIVKILFSAEIDMTDELTDYVSRQTKEKAQDIVEGISKETQKIVDKIKDLFS